MAAFVVNHRLALALRLLDTASGRPVSDRNLSLRRDGKPVHPMVKDDGTLVFMDEDRTDFELEVRAGGFEPRTVRVCYGELDARLPMLDVQLIPGAGYRSRFPCFSLEGTLPGISALDAVKAGESPCLIREVDPRRKQITIFNPHKLALDRGWYGLVDPDGETYEPFSVVKRVSDQVYRIDRVLETPFKTYFPVCPLVFGGVGPEGAYCLRVRDDTDRARWIVRYVTPSGAAFKAVDFRSESAPSLPE